MIDTCPEKNIRCTWFSYSLPDNKLAFHIVFTGESNIFGVTTQIWGIWWLRPAKLFYPNCLQIIDFMDRITLKFDGRPRKTIGHLFYAASSFAHHFIDIGESKLGFDLCDRDLWPLIHSPFTELLDRSWNYSLCVIQAQIDSLVGILDGTIP